MYVPGEADKNLPSQKKNEPSQQSLKKHPSSINRFLVQDMAGYLGEATFLYMQAYKAACLHDEIVALF